MPVSVLEIFFLITSTNTVDLFCPTSFAVIPNKTQGRDARAPAQILGRRHRISAGLFWRAFLIALPESIGRWNTEICVLSIFLSRCSGVCAADSGRCVETLGPAHQTSFIAIWIKRGARAAEIRPKFEPSPAFPLGC